MSFKTRIGKLLCFLGLHRYTRLGSTSLHDVQRCNRLDCRHASVSYPGTTKAHLERRSF